MKELMLNEIGKKEIADWFENFGKPNLNVELFFAEIERVGENDDDHYEVSRKYTLDGNTGIMFVEKYWFDVIKGSE